MQRRFGVLSILLGTLFFLFGSTAQAGTVPSGFEDTAVFSGLTEPTSVAISPDGRVFVAQKNGLIKVYDGLGDSKPDVFANLSTEVYNFWDRGLLGMALDPQFPARPYVYVLYTYDALPGGSAPKWGGLANGDGCPTPPGPTADGCVVTGRLSKLTASGNSMVAETPLITDWCQQYPSHSIGDLGFGADGDLYASGGEGASFTFADWGQAGNPVNPCGDPPGGVAGAMTPPTAEGGALRSQDVRTLSDPTGLDGSVIRIDPETGAGLPDNPLGASADANARRIVGYGLRNPFRFALRPGTNEVWVGDVGQSNWEEIDRIASPNDSSADNFGWPCYEGGEGLSLKHQAWVTANVGLCNTLYSQGQAGVTAPYYSYKHTAQVVPGESCVAGSSSVSGLAFYQSGPFPNAYNGALFFADYSRNCIWAMLPGVDGLPDPNNIQTFDAGASSPVNLVVGPDGALYYPDLTTGRVWRIDYASGNHPPSADATATPQDGNAPLEVQFSAAGSTDSDPGDVLTYAWDLDGDGEFDDSGGQSPTYTYTEAGVHVASVRVTDPDGAEDVATVSVQVDNTPPVATITSPGGGLTWAVGDPIDFSGAATDAQDGELPPSAFTWKAIMHHCPSNCHLHQLQTIDGQTEGTIVAPDHEYPSWLELQLTVTDSGGLTDTQSVTLYPQTATLHLASLPFAAAEIDVNGENVETPGAITLIKGSTATVAAPESHSEGGLPLAFGSWSDGGAPAHNVVVDQDTTLTATYGLPPAPTISGVVPGSPANENNPVISGAVGSDFPTSVEVYAAAGCTGAVAATLSAAQFSTGTAIAVPDDAKTTFSAAAVNAAGRSLCSNAVTYVEDSTPPAAPVLAPTNPASPSNHNTLKVLGSLGTGAPSQVRIFKSASCTGAPTLAATATFAGTGVAQVVADDTTTAFSADATDAAGNVSACSNAVTYVEDSIPPDPPTLATNTPSPSNHKTLKVLGALGAGEPTQVKLFKTATCTGASTIYPSTTFAGSGIAQTVLENSTTAFSLKAIDAAGNVSACSNAVAYVQSSLLP
jgi:glucose/arabinose dehydrogenase